MSTGGIIAAVLLLTVTMLVVVVPLLRGNAHRTEDSLHLQKQRERLLVYYERVLTNLRDLDEDYATGKMPDDAYVTEREEWVRRGVLVLRAMDTLEDHSLVPATVQDEAAVDEAIDDAIETAIAAYRKAEG